MLDFVSRNLDAPESFSEDLVGALSVFFGQPWEGSAAEAYSDLLFEDARRHGVGGSDIHGLSFDGDVLFHVHDLRGCDPTEGRWEAISLDGSIVPVPTAADARQLADLLWIDAWDAQPRER